MPLEPGNYLITTASGSHYYLELGEHPTLTRLPGAEPSTEPAAVPATALRRDAEALDVLSLIRLQVGQPAVFVLDLRGDGISTIRHTSPVTGIERLDHPGGPEDPGGPGAPGGLGTGEI